MINNRVLMIMLIRSVEALVEDANSKNSTEQVVRHNKLNRLIFFNGNNVDEWKGKFFNVNINEACLQSF